MAIAIGYRVASGGEVESRMFDGERPEGWHPSPEMALAAATPTRRPRK